MIFHEVKAACSGFREPRSLRGESMLHIILATARPKTLQAFAEALSSDPEVQLESIVSGAEALEAVRTSAPHLMIIDAGLPDIAPLDLVQKLLMVNAMVNTAVVSPLSNEEFHEASEGLGILGRLPNDPGMSDAGELLHKLRTVLGVG
jgi:DNA-binding NarL/FixJ family response regulator